MLEDDKLKWETKLGEIAEQTHLFLLYKSVLPVSSNAKPFQSRSFPRDAAGKDLASSEPGLLCTRLYREPCVTVEEADASRSQVLGAPFPRPAWGVCWPGLLCALPHSPVCFP